MAGLVSYKDATEIGCCGRGSFSWTNCGTGAGVAAGACAFAFACLVDTVSSQPARKTITPAATPNLKNALSLIVWVHPRDAPHFSASIYGAYCGSVAARNQRGAATF